MVLGGSTGFYHFQNPLFVLPVYSSTIGSGETYGGGKEIYTVFKVICEYGFNIIEPLTNTSTRNQSPSVGGDSFQTGLDVIKGKFPHTLYDITGFIY